MINLRAFSIQSISEGLKEQSILESIGNAPIIIDHDLFSGSTTVITESDNFTHRLSNVGISAKEVKTELKFDKDLLYFQVMAKDEPRRYERPDEKIEELNIYQLFRHKTMLLTCFMPADQLHTKEIKEEIEERISRIEVKATKNITSNSNRDSVHSDLYYGSDQKKLLSTILDNVNESILSRGASYKVGIIIENDSNSNDLIAYIKSSSIVLVEQKVRVKDITALYAFLRNVEGIPISYKNASKFIWLSKKICKNRSLITSKPRSIGQITIGSYLDSGIKGTEEKITIEKSIFNLGTLITGVPGTGKTMAAKHILSQFPENEIRSIVVISPTNEWDSFGRKFGTNVVDLGDSSIKVNFFKCEGKSVQKFYEDLSMLMASASNAGPYRSSIEKCLLAAFAKIYSTGTDPDPQEVYQEIEEAIIDQHAKRTSTSVKYTKHGENIKSSLESIRLILMKSQFAYSGGLNFRDLIKSGVIFNLSNISNSMKPLFYAFILNQIYSITDEFDINGDNELRSILCVEEAQLIFGGEEESAATVDLKQRIQNFRKKGIGLILVTHNVTDINPSIRRLCQIKIYFRQSPDIAKFAANDMLFEEDDYLRVAGMLKTLGQKICALSYIELVNAEKVPASSMFAKVLEFKDPPSDPKKRVITPKYKDTSISISEDLMEKGSVAELSYLGERIFNGIVGDAISIPNLLEGKKYLLTLKAQRKRDDRKYTIIGGTENKITSASSA